MDFAIEVLQHMFTTILNPLWKLEWPTEEEIGLSAQLLEKNRNYGPLLKGVFSVMDGAHFRNADYTNLDIQNGFYDGYSSDVEITNLLVFDFNGCLIHCGLNYPGSWNDSKISYLCGMMEVALSDENRLDMPSFAILHFQSTAALYVENL